MLCCNMLLQGGAKNELFLEVCDQLEYLDTVTYNTPVLLQIKY